LISKEESFLYSRLPTYKKRLAGARKIIADALHRCSNPYVAFSTGKDSTCTLHLVLEQVGNVDIVYFDADCALPESIEMFEYYNAQGLNIIKQKTEPLLETFRKHGLDNPRLEDITMKTTVYNPIKKLLAENNYDCVFLGLRAGESKCRSKLLMSRGRLFENKRDGIIECLPVGWWTERDVWAYIHTNNLMYNKAYDKGVERVSYWAGETRKRKGRWVTLKQYWPQLYNRFAAEFPEVRNYV